MGEIERRGMKISDNYQFNRQFKEELEDKQEVISELRIKETGLLESNERLQSEVKKLK